MKLENAYTPAVGALLDGVHVNTKQLRCVLPELEHLFCRNILLKDLSTGDSEVPKLQKDAQDRWLRRADRVDVVVLLISLFR
jgi:hypothetical protein